MTWIWSHFQEKIFKCVKETDFSICVNATAGSSKTTTIVEIAKRLPKHKHIIFLAFNVSIMKELKKRVPANVEVLTIHSFGARQLFKHFSGLKMNENKTFTTALRMYTSFGTEESKYVYCARISKLVGLMQLTLTQEPEQIEKLADRYGISIFEKEVENSLLVYKACYKNLEQIDFNDMIFQVAVRDIKLPKYDYVIVDEVQDLSKAAQTIVRKIIRPNTGRLIAVGDRHQSIYAFAGADFESYDRVKNIVPNTIELPLSISYRCPKVVIELAKTIVPEIEWWEQSNNVGKITLQSTITDIRDSDWVLCRNTLPLVYVFRELIKQNKKANIKGREIGQNLINLIKRTKREKVSNVLKFMQVYLIQLKSKLFRKGFSRPEVHPRYIDLLEKIEITKILSENITDTKRLIAKIESIFVDEVTSGIVLSTIHKAKGCENDRIFLLNKYLIPSKYAVTKDDYDQENNLLFVAYTRAKKELLFLEIPEDEILAALKPKAAAIKKQADMIKLKANI